MVSGWRLAFLGVLLGLGLAVAACSRGAYNVEVFPEMHYSQSYRSQEPPRLYPPAQSVPVGGKELVYSFGEASALENPAAWTEEAQARAAQIFRVECSVCHGPEGRGDGPMARYFQEAGVPVPVDLASDRVRARTEGQLYWILSNGLGFMPPYSRLVNSEERWLLVHYIQSIAGR